MFENSKKFDTTQLAVFLNSFTSYKMLSKEKIHAHFLAIANNSIARIEAALADLKESGTNETKSTAGDKHETALAMLQIEQANFRVQLKDAQEKKAMLLKLNPSFSTKEIRIGSVVITNKNIVYISTALGKQVINDCEIVAISPQSPLATKLLGLNIEETVFVNGNKFVVQNIL